MKNILFIVLLFFVLCCSCGTNESRTNEVTQTVKDSAVGKVDIYDNTVLAAIDSNANIEVIAKGFTWSEGPVWVADKKMLLFTDVPENKIYQWKEGDSAKLYLTPSGYTGSIKRIGGEDGANGLTLDKDGRLLLCQSGNRQVVRLNTPLDAPKPDFTVLSANYKGKKFNSPNDLVMDNKGNIYFTDPIYGLPQKENDSTRELSFEGVYKISADGKTTLLIDSIHNPNGIALSLDEKTLYIASSAAIHPKWFAYTLDEKGNIKGGNVLLDATEMLEKAAVKQGADGFKIDKYGNIFSAGPDGINIISPQGKLLGLIKVYKRRVSNCAFNETKDVLFITADDLVLKVKMHS
ncbi:SMP-30/gluconolactonase/LRE family protein [Panacibacter ginsenosidivorans]|uniref:SMP-30/gluconolactonase/LRE family protein n=1 Tax=Panacibacter ginsenosidivorans TaxID=1813871 RepID=A0A5B8V5I7_9BACT|nr:SMP-30/gluconolactonase/LRE family protein [Panacibacter ginsenosidivorans]QEC66650.1 SMP-30/gluconolactonase/LRE family protein [Panacibacter ginsenosidivorans]